MKLVIIMDLDSQSFGDTIGEAEALEVELVLGRFLAIIRDNNIGPGDNWTLEDTAGEKAGHVTVTS